MRGWRNLDGTPAEREKTMHWVMHHHISEPAYLAMNMFSISGHLVTQGRMDQQATLMLRNRVVATINKALNDPSRALSEVVILAVGRIALHELMFGDKKMARVVHRPAYLRMVAARGGFDALDFPRIVRWHIDMYERLWTQYAAASERDDYVRAHDEVREISDNADMRVLDSYLPLRRCHPGYR